MESRLKNKESKIIVIDPSGAVRQLLTDVFRLQEYKNVQAVANLKEAIHILEIESVDWIVTPLLSEQEPNALQLLKLITENIALKNTRVSLIISEEENEILPLAFENGLFSYFSKPFNKDSITNELKATCQNLEKVNWDDTKLSALYLKKYLEKKEDYEAIIVLNKALLNLFPGNARYLLDMVKPLFMTRQEDKAATTLAQVSLLDSSLESEVGTLQESLFPDKHLGDKINEGASINALGLKTCIVIDPDDAARKSIADTLNALGAEDIKEFESGDAAYEYIEKNSEPNLIIQEWRIPKLTGPLLIQRIRHKFPCVPIVIISSLITADDLPLVKEMGVANVVTKPFDRQQFLKIIVHTVQQDRLPTDIETLERKIRQSIEVGRMKEAANLHQKYQNIQMPKSRRAKIDAEFAYAQKKYQLARDLVIEAIKTQKDSIMLLNLLGKCFMRLRDFPAALKCFEKAQTISPMNIQRLCSIAEVNSEMGDHDAAQNAVDKAKSVDNDACPIMEVEAKFALDEGDLQKASKLMSKLDSITNIISYSNNKAIAYTRGGDIEAGINLYKKTIESIPENKKNLIPLVEYNLALAYARADDIRECKKLLEEVIAKGETRVLQKSKSLLKRVSKSLVKGTQVELNSLDASHHLDQVDSQIDSETENGKNLPKTEHLAIISQMEIAPGELCCYQIFFNPQTVDQKYLKLREKSIHFTHREAIERQMAGGVEKTIKSR